MSYILVSDGLVDWVADKAELLAAMKVLHWINDGDRWYEPEFKEADDLLGFEAPYSLLCQTVANHTDKFQPDQRAELPIMLWREDLKAWVL